MEQKSGGRSPDIFLIGTGVGGLQITVEGQRILDRVGKAYALHMSPTLSTYLRRLRVKVVDLSDLFDGPAAESYAAVAQEILDRVATEYPVVVLTPGSPMFLNSISRLLVILGRSQELTVRTVPGISPLDALISYIGLDLARYGLQVFTARHLATTPRRLDPTVPLAVIELAGIDDEESGHAALLKTLAVTYPPDHPATLVTVDGNGGAHATRPLHRFPDFVHAIRTESHLFIDAVRTEPRPRPTEEG